MNNQGRAGPSLHPPLSWPFLGLLLVVLVVAAVLLQVGATSVAYERLGLAPETALGLLLVSLVGSAVNIPVGRIESHTPLEPARVVRHMGVGYVIPRPWTPGHTVIAVNVGGAVVPVLLSIYLVIHDNLGLEAILPVAAVLLYVHLAARSVKGVGIAVPGLIPPLIAAGSALLLGGPHVPAVAYVAGVWGCLVGADLMNLGKIADMGSPVASIGGAGTFDGIFLTGIIAVLIASF